MAYPFPSAAWLDAFADVLNHDPRYAQVAKNWEGDVLFAIEPEGPSEEPAIRFYLDLWHGKCRQAYVVPEGEGPRVEPKFVLSAPRGNFLKILRGELDPMQAMLTRRLRVQGNMAYMLRNIPVVLDFVRCGQLVDIEDDEID